MKSTIPPEAQKLIELMDVIHSLRQALRARLQTKMREYDFGITYEMFQVLLFLWKKNGVNQQEIADNVQKNKASLTPLIDNLVKRKLVTRTEDSSDRRNKIISLTQEGVQFEEKFKPILMGFHEVFTTSISISQLESVINMLQKLQNNLEA